MTPEGSLPIETFAIAGVACTPMGITDEKGDHATMALVPDIVIVLDAEPAVPITNETLRHGRRVMGRTVRVPEIMRSPAALRQFGPAALGLDEICRPLAI